MGKYTDTFSIVPAEHVISYLIENYVKNVKEPAISDHLLQCDCLVNFDHSLAWQIENRLLANESLFIKCENQFWIDLWNHDLNESC